MIPKDKPVSSEAIKKLKILQNLISSQKDLITNNLIDIIIALATNQVNLIYSTRRRLNSNDQGPAKANPELLNLLDFAFDLIM